MTVLFASDVHLAAERPAMVEAFEALLARAAGRVDGMYLLGDVFDQWLGDDDTSPPHPAVEAALARLTATGTPVHVMHGNHDFLLGAEFFARTGCRALADPSVATLHGTDVLLMHGDSLCTDDQEYQAFRRMARDPGNQRQVLRLPLEARRAKAVELRQLSREHGALKPAEIMDVNGAAVVAALREHGVRHLVHGHTHRPGAHVLEVDGEPAERIVLADWYERATVLAWDAAGRRSGPLDEILPA